MRANQSSPFLRSSTLLLSSSLLSSTLLSSLLSLSACSESVSDSVGNSPSITFSAVVDDGWDGTRSVDKATFQEIKPVRFLSEEVLPSNNNGGSPLYLHTTVEPNRSPSSYLTSNTENTRGTLINSMNSVSAFGVSGYVYGNEKTLNDVSANFYHNAKVSKTVGLWQSTAAYNMPAAGATMAFKAYAPYGDANTVVEPNTSNGTLNLTYTVNPTVTKQTDLLVASITGEPFSTDITYRVPLTFRHALTAIRLELGDDIAPGYIKSVSFANIKTGGTLSVGNGWTYNTIGDITVNYSGSGFSTTGSNTVLADGTNTLLMIPQTFDDNTPGIKIVFNNGSDQTLVAPLRSAGTSWDAGKIVTYRISTSALNVIDVTVPYPTKWDSQDIASVKGSYADGESIGMYVVDTNTGLVVESNVRYLYDTTTDPSNPAWITPSGTKLKYKKSYAYYAYYPYQPTIAGGHAAGDDVSTVTTAEEFFADVTKNWTVSTGKQNTSGLFLANDLHICKGVAVNSFGKFNFPMRHAMGLIVLNLQKKSVATTRYFNVQSDGSVSATSYSDVGTSSITASSNFSQSGRMLAATATQYFYVVKSGTTLTASSSDTGEGKWAESSITMSSTEGTSTAYTANCARSYLYGGWQYSYQGKVQEFTVPYTRDYSVQCYGAAGGSGVYSGGYGGYAYGNIQLNAGQILYICVGGQGGSGTDKAKNKSGTVYGGSGGYNGGGYGGDSQFKSTTVRVTGGGGGGGATHIATTTNRGVLSAYKDYQSEVLLVAGGGGGGSKQVAAGTGGGTSGGTVTNTNKAANTVSGGGQTTGYAFGYGQNSTRKKVQTDDPYGGHGSGGGGGGWYGGYACINAGGHTNAGGGGGSGHIGGGFISGTTGMTNGSRSGDGLVRIASLVLD